MTVATLQHKQAIQNRTTRRREGSGATLRDGRARFSGHEALTRCRQAHLSFIIIHLYYYYLFIYHLAAMKR
jgi:hypothetical protein